jgi:ribosome biogenesis GTPase
MEIRKARVIKSTGSRYLAKDEKGNIFSCKLKGLFRIKGMKNTNPIAAGDEVDIEIGVDDEAVISHLHQRKNYLIRKATKLSKQYHIMASNLDQILLVVTLKMPETRLEFIDRVLVSAEAFQIPVLLCFNKTDVLNEEERAQQKDLISMYTAVGYACIETSVNNKLNLELLKEKLQGKTTLLSGNSGVGKSSLINAIDTSLDIRTSAISDYHKMGKHTTTFAEMFPLSFGGDVIDTPGIKGFGVIEIEKKELAVYFPEMKALLHDCKFYNCLHIEEPGCAVKKALENGSIHYSRYRSYLNIYFDDDDAYRPKGY